MTNGEKIKEIFGVKDEQIHEGVAFVTVDGFDCPKDNLCGGHDFFKNWWNSEYKEPTTKNDLAQERYQDLIEYFGDEKVAKTILESRKEFKAWLERLKWNVKRADELARELEQIKLTTKNDLVVDCISRADAIKAMQDKAKELKNEATINGLCGAVAILYELPPVTPQEPRKGKWTKDCQCNNCGERPYGYYGNVVYIKYCPNCGAKMESEE